MWATCHKICKLEEDERRPPSQTHYEPGVAQTPNVNLFKAYQRLVPLSRSSTCAEHDSYLCSVVVTVLHDLAISTYVTSLFADRDKVMIFVIVKNSWCGSAEHKDRDCRWGTHQSQDKRDAPRRSRQVQNSSNWWINQKWESDAARSLGL